MPDPKGLLVTPVGFRSDGSIHAFSLDDSDQLLVTELSHALLDGTINNDTIANAPARGRIIVGVLSGGNLRWSILEPGSVDDLLTLVAGPDPGWVSRLAVGVKVLIAETILSVNTISIDFQNIPATYRHLELECSLRGAVAATTFVLGVQFNNDAGADYDYERVHFVNTPATTITAAIAATSMQPLICTGNTGVASDFSPCRINIPYYATTDRNKELFANGFRRLSAAAASQIAMLGGGNWRNTAAINQVTLIDVGGANLLAGSRVSLYGLN